MFKRKQAPIVVVSGLPRSGTSLMMQVLAAGGYPILADNHRPPDENNPNGYYEYEPVKRLHIHDTAWLQGVGGQAVKVVSPLLNFLPPDYTYQVIFMRRDIHEIVRSQITMRQRLNDPETTPVEVLVQRYNQHLLAVLHWLRQQPNLTWQAFHYADLIHQTPPAVKAVQTFLGRPLNQNAMQNAVNPKLYRQRRD